LINFEPHQGMVNKAKEISCIFFWVYFWPVQYRTTAMLPPLLESTWHRSRVMDGGWGKIFPWQPCLSPDHKGPLPLLFGSSLPSLGQQVDIRQKLPAAVYCSTYFQFRFCRTEEDQVPILLYFIPPSTHYTALVPTSVPPLFRCPRIKLFQA
jgi:hypothetical protein